MKLLNAALALLAFAAAADLCLGGECAVVLPAPDACGAGCPAPGGEHAEHCAFCPCLCHATGILPARDADLSIASSSDALAEPPLFAAADFPAGLDRPPIAA